MECRHSPALIWITGLAGAGKTTLAARVLSEVRRRYANVVHIDGDQVRELFESDLGFSESDRLKNAYRIARLCKNLYEQDLLVVCSTVSLFPEIWAWNRANVSRYAQVYLKVSAATLHSRDKKQLYSTGAAAGQPVVGISQNFSEPLAESDLVLENDQADSLPHNTKMILNLIQSLNGK